MSRNSITPSRALRVIGERVLTSGGSPFGPGRQSRTPQAQLATGSGEPTSSTRHMRQLPAIDSRSWKQKRGISAPAASQACSSVNSAGTSISLPSTMSLVIALGLSELAVGWCDAGGLQGRLHPLLGVRTIGPQISRLDAVLLAQERQMRLQIIVAGSQPFGPAGERGDGFPAGGKKSRTEALVLNPLLAAARLDRVVVGLREFRIFERQIGVTEKRLPRAGRPIIGADFIDLKQDRHKAEQGYGRLRHLRQRPVFVPPQDARLRHGHYSAATI